MLTYADVCCRWCRRTCTTYRPTPKLPCVTCLGPSRACRPSSSPFTTHSFYYILSLLLTRLAQVRRGHAAQAAHHRKHKLCTTAARTPSLPPRQTRQPRRHSQVFCRSLSLARSRALSLAISRNSSTASSSRSVVLEAEDFMDDGTRIRLRVTVDGRDGTALFFLKRHARRGASEGICNAATCDRRLNRALIEPS
jgi:hypothetical protein